MKTQITIPTQYLITSAHTIHFILIPLIFITACSVFKEKSFLQADSLQKHSTRREMKTKESMQVDAVRIYNQQDSSDKQSFTEIFPEGLFNYSAKEGFTGIAKRVVINERLKASTKLRDSGKVSVTNNTVSATSESERLLTQIRLKEKTSTTRNSTIWYLGALLLIFAALFVFRWKLND